MPTHPMIQQLRFTRSEFRRGLAGLSDEDARRQFMPMNCISWNVGHMAAHEQQYFLYFPQGQILQPALKEQFAYGAPASTPALADVLAGWEAVTQAADAWLDTVTTAVLAQPLVRKGKPMSANFGSLLQRVIYHYWYHTGENMAIRQLLGHADLPEFVGDIGAEAPYLPES